MARTRIRSDDQGLYVRADGRVFRPGEITGLPRADMSDEGLTAGDAVKAHHVSGTTRARITGADGHVLFWHEAYQHEREAEFRRSREAMEAAGIDPREALYEAMGIRPARLARPPSASKAALSAARNPGDDEPTDEPRPPSAARR